MTQVLALSGDTIDAICWRHLGRTAGVTEQTLDMNEGIAAFGPIIARDTIINLPDANTASIPAREIINLWSVA